MFRSTRRRRRSSASAHQPVWFRSTFRGAASVELLSARVGARPMPADGEPVVGPVADVPGLYLAVMHAAVTLAPGVGRLVARELVDGTPEPGLADCRLDRFQH